MHVIWTFIHVFLLLSPRKSVFKSRLWALWFLPSVLSLLRHQYCTIHKLFLIVLLSVLAFLLWLWSKKKKILTSSAFCDLQLCVQRVDVNVTWGKSSYEQQQAAMSLRWDAACFSETKRILLSVFWDYNL